jgi:DNA-binding MarR family transcriptional regulator
MELTVKNLLLQELERRRTRNSAYSLRAFARDLKLGVTTLSDVLADKRSLSKSNLQKVLDRLAVSPLERETLWSHHRVQASRAVEPDERTVLDEDTFRLIADWQYLAILNLAKLPQNQARPEWIAERLGLKVDEASEALERLLRLQLVKKTRGRLERTSRPLTTSKDIPSAAIRKHHSQNLVLADASLHRDPVHLREFASATLAVNLENLPLAKDILHKARKKIGALLETGPVTEVYTFSFQLFPLTRLQDPTEDKNETT